MGLWHGILEIGTRAFWLWFGGVRAKDRDDMPNCTGGRRRGTELAEPGSHGDVGCGYWERALTPNRTGPAAQTGPGATGTGSRLAGEWLDGAPCLGGASN
jgi:hypothetical protein